MSKPVMVKFNNGNEAPILGLGTWKVRIKVLFKQKYIKSNGIKNIIIFM